MLLALIVGLAGLPMGISQGQDEAEPPTGAIYGSYLTDAGLRGSPNVYLVPVDRGAGIQHAVVEPDGSFHFFRLEPGVYRVVESPPSLPLNRPIDELLAARFRASPDVVIDERTVVSGVELTRGVGGSISGSVDVEGDISQIGLYRETSSGWVFDGPAEVVGTGEGETFEPGVATYEIRDIRPGRFVLFVHYSTPPHDDSDADEEVGRVISPAFNLDDGDHLDVPPWRVGQSGAISGRVTGPAPGEPVPGQVSALVRWGSEYLPVAFASVEQGGTYRFPVLAPGQYRLLFGAENTSRLADQYWPSADSADEGLDVTVLSGLTTPGVDAVLTEGAVVEGALTTPGDVAAEARLFQRTAQGRWVALARSVGIDAGGYRIQGLLPGSYRIRASGLTAGVSTEFFDDVGLVEDARTVEIRSREDVVPDIDIELEESACLLGELLTRDGEGLGGTSLVTAYRKRAGQWRPYVQVRAGSEYEISDLPPGTYRVGVSDDGLGAVHRDAFFGDALTVEEAQDVVLEAGINEGDLDIELDLQARALSEPKVVGEPRVGGHLVARPPLWSPQGAATRYQWLANGTPIPDATRATYTPTSSDRGKRLAVATSGSHPRYVAAVARSAATSPVGSRTRVESVRKPRIRGQSRVGRTVRVSGGRWAPKDVTLRYRWFGDGKVLRGERGKRLRLRPVHRGIRIKVRVTARSPEFRPRRVIVRSTGRVRGR